MAVRLTHSHAKQIPFACYFGQHVIGSPYMACQRIYVMDKRKNKFVVEKKITSTTHGQVKSQKSVKSTEKKQHSFILVFKFAFEASAAFLLAPSGKNITNPRFQA